MLPVTLLNSKTKSIIIYISLALIVLTTLRELGFADFNWYRSWSNISSSTDWDCRTMSINLEPSKSLEYSQVPQPLITILSDQDTLYEESSNEVEALRNRVIITIKEIDYGFLWIPIYKSSTYTAVAEIKYIGTYNEPIASNNVHAGITTLNGNISIFGICSRRFAVKLVQDFIKDNLVNESRRHLSEKR